MFYVYLRVNVAAILVFYLLSSNVYSWFTKLLQISHIIVSIFCGVITMYIDSTYLKMADVLNLKVK